MPRLQLRRKQLLIALVGEPVEIIWAGPGYDRDYVTVATPDQKGSNYLAV